MKCAYECPCGDESEYCEYPECGYCNKDAEKAGYCIKHYFQKYRAGLITKEYKNRTLTCEIEGCNKPYRARGFCKQHYDILYSHGYFNDD